VQGEGLRPTLAADGDQRSAPGGGEVVGERPGPRVKILCDRDPLHVTLSRFGRVLCVSWRTPVPSAS
jgi:hypothetical protein